MAGFVLLDAQVSINGVDLTDYCSKVTVDGVDREVKDVTGFGSGGIKENALGLSDPKMSMTFHNQFGAGLVNATLGPIARNGTAVPVVVRAHDAAISATNPEWTMTGVLPKFTNLDGAPGDVSDTEANFVNAGASGIVEDIIP